MNSEEKIAIFVEKLWCLLTNYDKNYNLVIWTKQGTAFAIIDRK